jgi:hypothetical protein
MWRPGASEGVWFVIALVAPMIAVAIALRLAFSPRFG